MSMCKLAWAQEDKYHQVRLVIISATTQVKSILHINTFSILT